MVYFEILGKEKLSKFLYKIQRDINEATLVALQEGGILLKDEIKASIAGQRAEPRSVDTGEFLASIETHPEGYDAVSVNSNVPQSLFMEYGTVHIEERRHFRNSLDRTKDVITENINKAIIQKVG